MLKMVSYGTYLVMFVLLYWISYIQHEIIGHNFPQREVMTGGLNIKYMVDNFLIGMISRSVNA